ncbi:uncharacterized protein MKZ38_002810 [Zalerion maritima]|uniref:mannan endo-1,4-beta-mannosidase n=1 Tax=Zalerion maritima TaxID=339359 RepID=A0AAD5RQ03_9PEZI|nr:uncharacterized protein MKZ38_002810 [Zalerion maritima]
MDIKDLPVVREGSNLFLDDKKWNAVGANVYWLGLDENVARLQPLASNDANNPQIQEFYTNPAIVADFKDYIQKVVAHLNPYTNMTYAEDSTIFAYETRNEFLGPVWGGMNCPTEWVEDIARFVKNLAHNKLFVNGTYGVNEELDIFSNH